MQKSCSARTLMDRRRLLLGIYITAPSPISIPLPPIFQVQSQISEARKQKSLKSKCRVRAKKPAKIKNDERVGKHMYKR